MGEFAARKWKVVMVGAWEVVSFALADFHFLGRVANDKVAILTLGTLSIQTSPWTIKNQLPRGFWIDLINLRPITAFEDTRSTSAFVAGS
ncbi:hypothetical protein MFRU_014g00940 [Monilinia fructicola]|nr:hypothetical protein MFRU_014g00940 [Monilinia fructicola]